MQIRPVTADDISALIEIDATIESSAYVHVDRTGPLRIDTGAGQVRVGAVTGNAEVKTGSGQVRTKHVGRPHRQVAENRFPG